jgi:hypothetical protein
MHKTRRGKEYLADVGIDKGRPFYLDFVHLLRTSAHHNTFFLLGLGLKILNFVTR